MQLNYNIYYYRFFEERMNTAVFILSMEKSVIINIIFLLQTCKIPELGVSFEISFGIISFAI